MDRRLVDHFRWQGRACNELGSAFYGILIDELADDLDRGGPVADVVADFVGNPRDAALCLRLVGTVHRHVLTGLAPKLAAHYPSAGGDGDAHAAASKLLTYLTENLEEVREGLESAPQTNEVGRSAALFGTLLILEPQLPVRLFEVGASAGLNLLADHYRYQADDGWWGPEASPVLLEGAWNRLPSDIRPQIVERRGIDLSPVDASTDEGATTLMGYVWPDQHDRIERLRSAIFVAQKGAGDGGSGQCQRSPLPARAAGRDLHRGVAFGDVAVHRVGGAGASGWRIGSALRAFHRDTAVRPDRLRALPTRARRSSDLLCLLRGPRRSPPSRRGGTTRDPHAMVLTHASQYIRKGLVARSLPMVVSGP